MKNVDPENKTNWFLSKSLACCSAHRPYLPLGGGGEGGGYPNCQSRRVGVHSQQTASLSHGC